MANFLDNMKKQASLTETLNGATAYKTTQNSLLDFFAEVAALRNSDNDKIITLFEKSFIENPLLTMKCLFYARDIRGGQGERRVFRVLIKHIANTRPDVMRANLHIVYEYGRYDDLLILLETKLKKDVIAIFKKQLRKDLKQEHPSLLAKWLPSCHTTSANTRGYASCIRKSFGMTEKEYRTTLAKLREKIRVTERLISDNRWSELNLDKLTANNYLKYQNAFKNHLPEEWENYINNVKAGNSSVKSDTLYPYNIVNRAKHAYHENVDLCDEMWNALPDYTNGQFTNSLCMVDVSGSMETPVSGGVTAMDVAVSLGLYISERVDGPFKNHFLTFSSEPDIVEVYGSNLKEKVNNMMCADWGMSTNLKKAFKLILDTAISCNASQEEMPEKLIVISDMQFDYAVESRGNKTLYHTMKEEFEEHGYKMPTIVFWNVDSKKTTFQVSENDKNVLLCSGCSPVILKGVLKYDNPIDLLMDTLNDPRYDLVRV